MDVETLLSRVISCQESAFLLDAVNNLCWTLESHSTGQLKFVPYYVSVIFSVCKFILPSLNI